MISQDLEFSISQYVDGGLSPVQRTALERLVAENPEARAMVDEYRRMNVVLRSSPLPSINFEALASSISLAIDEAEDDRVARRYRMPSWVRAAAMPLSLAASLLIVAGIGIKVYLSHPSSITSPSIVHSLTGNEQVAIEIGPPSAPPSGPSQLDVSIGPAAGAQDQPLVSLSSSGIISQSSHVTIASGGMSVQDAEQSSSFDIE